MNGVGSNEFLDIGGRPWRKRGLALDEGGIVVEDGESLGPKFLVAFPVPPEEGLRGRIFHNCSLEKQIRIENLEAESD